MLRHIKYFQAVAKYNSFSEAAEECHISQSAISQQVKALENELGFLLLKRKNRKFELTEAGEFFIKKPCTDKRLRTDMRAGGADSTSRWAGFAAGVSGGLRRR